MGHAEGKVIPRGTKIPADKAFHIDQQVGGHFIIQNPFMDSTNKVRATGSHTGSGSNDHFHKAGQTGELISHLVFSL